MNVAGSEHDVGGGRGPALPGAHHRGPVLLRQKRLRTARLHRFARQGRLGSIREEPHGGAYLSTLIECVLICFVWLSLLCDGRQGFCRGVCVRVRACMWFLAADVIHWHGRPPLLAWGREGRAFLVLSPLFRLAGFPHARIFFDGAPGRLLHQYAFGSAFFSIVCVLRKLSYVWLRVSAACGCRGPSVPTPTSHLNRLNLRRLWEQRGLAVLWRYQTHTGRRMCVFVVFTAAFGLCCCCCDFFSAAGGGKSFPNACQLDGAKTYIFGRGPLLLLLLLLSRPTDGLCCCFFSLRSVNVFRLPARASYIHAYLGALARRRRQPRQGGVRHEPLPGNHRQARAVHVSGACVYRLSLVSPQGGWSRRWSRFPATRPIIIPPGPLKMIGRGQRRIQLRR